MAAPAITQVYPDTQTTATAAVVDQVTYLNRGKPAYLVEIEDRNLSRIGYTHLVESIVVEETDDEAPLAVVRLTNSGGRLTDSLLFANGTKLLLSTGWKSRLVDRGGFIVFKPTFKFGYEGRDVVELVAYGEIAELAAAGEKRREWRQVRDSDVVQTIAYEYGLTADVDQTEPRHEILLQANESDIQFVRRLARRHGFNVFVRGQKAGRPVLHFHQRRYDIWGEDVALQYRGLSAAGLEYFEVCPDTFLSARQIKATQVDPLTAEIVNEQSTDTPDEFSKKLKSMEGNRLREWRKLAEYKNNLPVQFLCGTDMEQTRQTLREAVETTSQASRYLVNASATGIGAEAVQAGGIVTILGADKFSGKYYVRRVVHRIDVRSGYAVDLDIRRTSIQEIGTENALGTVAGPRADISQDMKVVGKGTVNAKGWATVVAP